MAKGFTCKGTFPFGMLERPDYVRVDACADLDEYEDTGYCVLHFPGEKKKEDFEGVIEGKLARKDYNFRGTIFPEYTSHVFLQLLITRHPNSMRIRISLTQSSTD